MAAEFNLTTEPTSEDGISVILLSWKRPHNISVIMAELRRVEAVREIIVWNNNPDIKLSLPDCKVINSSHNFMPFARYGVATLTSCNTLLFQDDDMLFHKDGIERAYAELLRDPGRIYGSEGRNLQNGTYDFQPAYGECDIVLGQFMLFSRALLCSTLGKLVGLAPFERGDDIAFSMLSGRKPMALNLSYDDLGKRDDVALFKQPGHGGKRQLMVDRVRLLMTPPEVPKTRRQLFLDRVKRLAASPC